MYTKILVPLDGSELAECSLEHVKKVVAMNNNSEVILLRVIEPISSNDASAWAQAGYAIVDVIGRNRTNAEKDLSHAA